MTEASLFCHCGALATAYTVIQIDGKDVVVRACKRCHPKSTDMVEQVNAYMYRGNDAPSFTPEQLLDMMEDEDKVAWAVSKERAERAEVERRIMETDVSKMMSARRAQASVRRS